MKISPISEIMISNPKANNAKFATSGSADGYLERQDKYDPGSRRSRRHLKIARNAARGKLEQRYQGTALYLKVTTAPRMRRGPAPASLKRDCSTTPPKEQFFSRGFVPLSPHRGGRRTRSRLHEEKEQ